MSWPPCTTSITNNTHILESFHMHFFLESNNHLVPQLKYVWESSSTSSVLFVLHRKFQKSNQQISVCSSNRQYFSYQSSITKTAFNHFISVKRSVFFFLCILTSSLWSALQQSVLSFKKLLVIYLLMPFGSLQSHLTVANI